MNKPPERLMKGKPGQRIVYIGNGFLPSYEDFQRAFILEEEKPMTQKTENLTTQEAWAAMARGECVKGYTQTIYRIKDRVLSFWNQEDWYGTTTLGAGPYSIVPDPSKPKEVEDEYAKDKQSLIKGSFVGEALRIAIVDFVERNFEKRKP